MEDVSVPASTPAVAPVSSPAGDIPAEIKGWSWGGFLWGWIWGVGNNVWISLLAFIPGVAFIMSIVLGLKGREWAWRSKHWDNVEHFKRVQRNWVKWWFIIILPLVALSFIAVFASIVLVALNPSHQFALANNTKRTSDVNILLNSVKQYAQDHKGVYPTGLSGTPTVIDSNNGKQICQALVPEYVSALPVDPDQSSTTPITDCASTWNTGYTISLYKAADRVTVSAPDAELDEVITVSR